MKLNMILTFLILPLSFSSTYCQKSEVPEVRLSPILEAKDFSWGNISAKGYKFSLEIENQSKDEIQLGDAVLLWEIGPNDEWTSVIFYLEKSLIAEKTKGFAYRYSAKDDHAIDTSGTALITAVGGGGFSVCKTKLFNLEGVGKGFGIVTGGMKKTISWDLPMPVFADKENVTSIWVAPPEMYSSSKRAWAPWIKYTMEGAKPKFEKLGFIPLGAEQLRAGAGDPDTFLRLLTIAKIAEFDAENAGHLLMSSFATEKTLIAKSSIIANLGWIGYKPAGTVMLNFLDTASTQRYTLESLLWAITQIKPEGAVPAIAELLNKTEYHVLCIAVKAFGELKDKSAIPLLEEFRDRVKGLHLNSYQKEDLDYYIRKSLESIQRTEE